MKIVPVLDNIRSSYNVGAILRTAEGLGVTQVICSGYTPFPNEGSGRLPHVVEKERSAIHKTALGAETMLKLEYAKSLSKRLMELKEQGYKLAGLENNLADERIVALNNPQLKERLGERVALVLGEEVCGLSQSILEMLDVLIEIPMLGQKESFNVSVAAGIALYQLQLL